MKTYTSLLNPHRPLNAFSFIRLFMNSYRLSKRPWHIAFNDIFIWKYWRVPTLCKYSSTHWPLVDVIVNSKVWFLNPLWRTEYWVLAAQLLSGECHRTSLMRDKRMFRYWHGAASQHVVTWCNVDPALCQNMASIGHKAFVSLLLYQCKLHQHTLG